jgi:membrane associated rhomboid family serine protease
MQPTLRQAVQFRTLYKAARATLLVLPLGASLGIMIGLVFLMTPKPTLSIALTAAAFAIGAGVILNWPFARESALPRTKH